MAFLAGRQGAVPRWDEKVLSKLMSALDHNELRSREIEESDFRSLSEFLGLGLGYPSAYYLQILERLAGRPHLPNFPKYGYLLENDETIVGAILLIFTQFDLPDIREIRCHVTSWYVAPAYRTFGSVFFNKALNLKGVTYINISARASARPFLKIQGFSKYSSGQFLPVPLLSSFSLDKQVKVVGADTIPPVHFETFERNLLLDHAKYGCLSLWCCTSERAHPFVFQWRYFKGFIPGVQLVYCSDVKDLVRFATKIRLYLACHGRFFLRIDANGPIAGLFGSDFDGLEPRYYKGKIPPRLGDLAYTP